MTAADYINQAFNGQKGFRDHENCETCGNENAEKKCSSCKFQKHYKSAVITLFKIRVRKNSRFQMVNKIKITKEIIMLISMRLIRTKLYNQVDFRF